MELGHIDKVGISVIQEGTDVPLGDKYDANDTPTTSPSHDLRPQSTNFDEHSNGSIFSDDPSSQDPDVVLTQLLFNGANDLNNVTAKDIKRKVCVQLSNTSVSTTLSFPVNDKPQSKTDTNTTSKSSTEVVYGEVCEAEDPKPYTDLEHSRSDPWLRRSSYEEAELAMKADDSSKLG